MCSPTALEAKLLLSLATSLSKAENSSDLEGLSRAQNRERRLFARQSKAPEQ
jgi:hypothetical protein